MHSLCEKEPCSKWIVHAEALFETAKNSDDKKVFQIKRSFGVNVCEEEEEGREGASKNIILMSNEKSRIDNSRTECVIDVKIYLLG